MLLLPPPFASPPPLLSLLSLLSLLLPPPLMPLLRRLSLFCLCLDWFVLGDLDRRDRQARAWLPGEPIVCASRGKADPLRVPALLLGCAAPPLATTCARPPPHRQTPTMPRSAQCLSAPSYYASCSPIERAALSKGCAQVLDPSQNAEFVDLYASPGADVDESRRRCGQGSYARPLRAGC